jgi:tetratricopeptide (TPR) repeat protein
MLRAMDSFVEKRQTPRLESLRLVLRAEVALAQGKASEAVEAAQAAVHYENSTMARETLARSYMAAAKNDEAIREYERVLARSGERAESYDAPAFHHVVETHYRLAVLYEKSGQTDRARSHLETFLKYWSQADSDLEIYKDAKRRLRSVPLGLAPPRGTPTPAA